MSFFSRPNLDDIQFKQTTGSTLSLSGLTRIRTVSGLTLSDGAGGDVLISASGASTATTQGYVLTYMDGLISLQPSSASGGTFQFDTDRYTTRSGVPSVCVGGECSVNNFLETYFFPAVGPSSSISVASGGVSREFGDCGVGNLSYSATRETNQICLVAVDTTADGSYNELPVTTCIAGDCSGTFSYSYPFTCATPATGTSQTSVTFKVCVQDSATCTSTNTASITWRNNVFAFKSTTLYTDDSITTVFTGGNLATSKAKSISNSVFNNQFFYYAYPASFGTPIFTVNGLPNNAWGNSSTGTLFKVNYTNSNGYLNQYYVARSDSRITGTYNINIS